MIWQQREPNWFHNSPFQNRRNLLYPLIYSFHLAWTSIVESFVRFGKSHRLESLSRRPFHMKLQGYSQVLWVFFPFIFLSFFPFLRVLSSVNVRVEKWLNLKRSVTIREVFKKKVLKNFKELPSTHSRIHLKSFDETGKEFRKMCADKRRLIPKEWYKNPWRMPNVFWKQTNEHLWNWSFPKEETF